MVPLLPTSFKLVSPNPVWSLNNYPCSPIIQLNHTKGLHYLETVDWTSTITNRTRKVPYKGSVTQIMNITTSAHRCILKLPTLYTKHFDFYCIFLLSFNIIYEELTSNIANDKNISKGLVISTYATSINSITFYREQEFITTFCKLCFSLSLV